MEGKQQTQIITTRTGDFISRYANNVRFEANAFDIKFIFGQSDQSTGKEVIEQHTAIAIPWAVLKVGLFYLNSQLAIQEIVNGVVTVPPNQVPAPVSRDDFPPDDPIAERIASAIGEIRERFIREHVK
jgi:hypothetical protein